MYNWSTDIKTLKKQPEQYARWRLEQLINFGLQGELLSEAELNRYWSKLELDPDRKRFLALLRS